MKTGNATKRGFNLLDAAILVAVVAFGLMVLDGGILDDLRSLPDRWKSQGRRLRYVLQLDPLLYLTSPILSSWSLGLLAIRLRRPRPRNALLWRQPGFVASVVACAFLAYNLLLKLVFVASSPERLQGLFERSDKVVQLMKPLTDAPQMGSAVAASWLVLAMSGRWKSDPGLIDRSGRFVGILWIVVYFTGPIHRFLPGG